MLFFWHHCRNGPRNWGPPSDLMLDGHARVLNHVSNTLMIDCVVVVFNLLYRGGTLTTCQHKLNVSCLHSWINRVPRVPWAHRMHWMVGLSLSDLFATLVFVLGTRCSCLLWSWCHLSCSASSRVVVPMILFFLGRRDRRAVCSWLVLLHLVARWCAWRGGDCSEHWYHLWCFLAVWWGVMC